MAAELHLTEDALSSYNLEGLFDVVVPHGVSVFGSTLFVRPESEQYCSQPRLYALNQCSEPVASLANCIGRMRK